MDVRISSSRTLLFFSSHSRPSRCHSVRGGCVCHSWRPDIWMINKHGAVADSLMAAPRPRPRTCIYNYRGLRRLRRFSEAPWETASPCSCHRMRLLLLLRLFVLFYQRNNIRIRRLTEVTPPSAGLQGPGAEPAGSLAPEQGLKTGKNKYIHVYFYLNKG